MIKHYELWWINKENPAPLIRDNNLSKLQEQRDYLAIKLPHIDFYVYEVIQKSNLVRQLDK